MSRSRGRNLGHFLLGKRDGPARLCIDPSGRVPSTSPCLCPSRDLCLYPSRVLYLCLCPYRGRRLCPYAGRSNGTTASTSYRWESRPPPLC